jgi:hypothetical protein
MSMRAHKGAVGFNKPFEDGRDDVLDCKRFAAA